MILPRRHFALVNVLLVAVSVFLASLGTTHFGLGLGVGRVSTGGGAGGPGGAGEAGGGDAGGGGGHAGGGGGSVKGVVNEWSALVAVPNVFVAIRR